jgi:hypothetical protein
LRFDRIAGQSDDHVAVGLFSSRSGRDLDWEYQEHGELKTVAMRSGAGD